MFERLRAWVDGVTGAQDPRSRSRVRVQHLLVLVYLIIGLPYVGAFSMMGLHDAALILLGIIAISTGALFGWTRRGHLRRGGIVISLALFLNLLMAMVGRGGISGNAAAWMLVTPVLGGFMVGPRHAAHLSVAIVFAYVGIWALELSGVPLVSALPPDIQRYMPVFDYTAIALTMGVSLWAQADIWDGVIRDLDRTNLQLQEQVRERERAEGQALDAARARYTFLATMSHEIRTPLNGVLGLTNALLHTPLNTDQRRLADTVQRSGKLLRSLLDDVLDFSKIDSGRLEMELQPVDMRALCEGVVELWLSSAEERGLTLACETSPMMPVWVSADANKLRQILGNLVSNALKFTHSGGVTLEALVDDQRLKLSVRDTGIGMNPQELGRIFELFEQGDGTHSRRHGGTGLGLAICRRLAHFLDGEISVHSTPGQGSTFVVDLPLVLAVPPSLPSPAKERVDPLKGLSVLIAEDNLINQMVITRLLERHGARVQVAANGQECVDKWRDDPPDVILMDCQMPICDGFQATERIRGQGGTLPIIALTANSMPGDRARCLEVGMNEHLGKPIQESELVAALAQWTELRHRGTA